MARQTKADLELKVVYLNNRLSHIERELDLAKMENRILKDSPNVITLGSFNCTLQRMTEALGSMTQGLDYMLTRLLKKE